VHLANVTSSVLLSTLLFAALFRFLPDVHVRWRDVWAGATVTALLFTAGKALIAAYLGHSNLGSVYGAAGTVIVLLAWVYYSSQILFFGAVFTRCHAEAFGRGIQPSSHAVRVKLVEMPADDTTS
jgi:membrane protein